MNNLNNVYTESFDVNNPTWIYENCTTKNGSIRLQGDAKAYINKYFTFDTYHQKSTITLNNTNSKFGLMCHYEGKGALYLVDGVSKSIKLFGQYMGGDIPYDIKAETKLNFDLVENQNYILEVIKTGWKHTFKITCAKTLNTSVVEFDNSTQVSSEYYCGKGWGGPGIRCFEGDVTYNDYVYDVLLYPTTEAIFIGDSITEGTSMGKNVDINLRWCSRLRDELFNSNAVICGRGGDITSGVINRLNDLYSIAFESKYVVVLIGTNQRSVSGLNDWKEEIVQIHDLIISKNTIPIIAIPPLAISGLEYLNQMRDFILEKGWNTIRFDFATSIDKDGVVCDTSMFTDGVHPGEKGSNAMFNQGMTDLEPIVNENRSNKYI